jgi:hypothetical protein
MLNRLSPRQQKTAETIAQSIKATAHRLVRGLADSNEGTDRDEMDREPAAQKHRAEAAQQALTEVNELIERKMLQLKRLREREREFLDPAIDEAFAASGARKILDRLRAELAAVENAVERFKAELPNTLQADARADVKLPRGVR